MPTRTAATGGLVSFAGRFDAAPRSFHAALVLLLNEMSYYIPLIVLSLSFLFCNRKRQRRSPAAPARPQWKGLTGYSRTAASAHHPQPNHLRLSRKPGGAGVLIIDSSTIYSCVFRCNRMLCVCLLLSCWYIVCFLIPSLCLCDIAAPTQ